MKTEVSGAPLNLPLSLTKICIDDAREPGGDCVILTPIEASAGVVAVAPTTRRHVTSPANTWFGSELVIVTRALPRAATPVWLLRALKSRLLKPGWLT
jgi:hypothetical protein